MLLNTLSKIESREISTKTSSLYRNLVVSKTNEALARLEEITGWEAETDSEESLADYDDFQSSPIINY